MCVLFIALRSRAVHAELQHCIIAGQNVLDHGNYLEEVQIKMPQGKKNMYYIVH